MKGTKKSKKKRVTLKQKHKISKKSKRARKKKAKKLGLNSKQKVEKDPGIPKIEVDDFDNPNLSQRITKLSSPVQSDGVESEVPQKPAGKKQYSSIRRASLAKKKLAKRIEKLYI